jgi:hypothetical protein
VIYLERKTIPKKTLFFMGIILALYVVTRQPIAYAQFENQTVFASPFSIDGASVGIGNSVTVYINISNGWELWSAQTGLKFNSTVLSCTGVAIGEFWSRQGVSPLWYPGAINNTSGEVAFCGMGLASPAVVQNGSGTLMTATFQVKAAGISDIHLLNVKTNTRVGTSIVVTTCRVLDNYTIAVGASTYVVSILHNATGVSAKPATGIPSLTLNQTGKYIAYDMTFKSYKTGVNMDVYCNVTIPKNFLHDSPWTVKVDGVAVTPTITEDTENTYIRFTTTYTTATTTKKVQIQGTWVIPEMYPLMMLPLLIMGLSIAFLLAAGKTRKGNIR